MTTTYSRHAFARIGQRGIRAGDIELILAFGSHYVDVGGGLVSVGFSYGDEDWGAPAMRQSISRVQRTRVIIDPQQDHVVTVIKGANTHYTRQR